MIWSYPAPRRGVEPEGPRADSLGVNREAEDTDCS